MWKTLEMRSNRRKELLELTSFAKFGTFEDVSRNEFAVLNG